MKLNNLSPWARGHQGSTEGELCYPSPNGKFTAYLQHEGDIRFGPSYFSLLVNSKRFRGRSFGAEIFWSSDSRYLDATEWQTTEEAQGPHTSLLLVEPETQREVVVSEFVGGFVCPLRFYPESVTFSHERGNERYLYNVAFAELEGWRSIP